MTSPESSANETIENAFTAPEADLTDTTQDDVILGFKRFSAWWVFLLGMITQNLYSLYWLYSRAQTTNMLAKENKVNLLYLFVAIPCIIIGVFTDIFIDEFQNETLLLATGILTFVGLIFWVIFAFSMRKPLTEIINRSSADNVHLSGLLTFLFSSIYFQYKINEAIDNIKTQEQ